MSPQHRGFVLGELFFAILLLALAISTVSALMYTATRVHRTPRPAVASATTTAGTAPAMKTASAATLLVAGCATRSGSRVQACEDSGLLADGAEGTTIRSRTDSASLELLPKRQKRAPRTDLGFIR